VVQVDRYFLGYRREEQEQLQRQEQMLLEEVRWLFDQIGIPEGAAVVEVGCGPRGTLDLLSERVGTGGIVTGVERNEDSVKLARQFLAERDLRNVEVVLGDARATGLPRGVFDVATARQVLVNVPNPEQIVGEMVALVRPGGIVALYEADFVGVVCDPPLPAWNQLTELFSNRSSMNGIDLFVGRKIPRMLREAGLIDIETITLIHVASPGHQHRTLLLDFAENLRERLIEFKLIGEAELNDLVTSLRWHIEDPDTLVLPGIFSQVWGRRPLQKAAGASIATSTVSADLSYVA